MNDGVLSAIGNTPLIRLSRIFPDLPFNFYAKLEGHNPGGSMKDRPALSIIRRALRRHLAPVGAPVGNSVCVMATSSS